ncbi:unnamed protein product [Lactuca virosa]|uniref:IAA-alanine resistance protein 1 n=1 Tax=Lactuca virosa TaxID=75947 RepID=A0AAU9LQE5_9ASTR|nr:unnamed protein product [Lactuca virosa]
MALRQSKKQICSLLIVLVLTIGFNFEASFGQQCQHSSEPEVHESHEHHHNCDHSHDDHHHHHQSNDDHHHHHDLGRKKLPEELAEEDDLRLEYVSHHDHNHDHHHAGDSELSGVGLWIHAMGCSLLVSLASLICLILLPLIFFQGKPSKTFVDSLAVFGAGAMLGDAFLHQLPHAFGGGHSHSHDNHTDDAHDHDHDHDHSPSHSHSIEDLSVGLSILFGIVVFLLVEKIVRYVEERSRGVNSWGHHHHRHHHKKNESLEHVNDDDDKNTSETTSDESLKTQTQDESSLLRKRNISTNGDKIDEKGPKSDTNSITGTEPAHSSSLVFGYLNLFSDGVHNFTDGMALGSAFLLYGSVGGWSRTLFLLAHELPQEIGDFGILVRSGFSVFKALFFNFLSALVALAGTALALLWGQDPGQSSLIEGFTAGGFIYIAVGVMAEMNNGSSSIKTSVIQLTSLVMGMSVALFISLIE